MKKLSLVTIILFVLSHYAFAEPSAPTSTVQSVPVEAINVPDVEDTDTSPVTDMDPLTEDESVFVDTHLKAVPKTDHDENAEYHYTIDVTYPQIAGGTLSPTTQQFNQIIHQMIQKEIDQFKNSVKMDLIHMNTLPEEARKNTFNIDYDIDVIKPDSKTSIVSVRLSIEGMQAGRAHPFHAHRVLNFDLTQGKELALKDLFKKNASYLTTIANYSHNKLNQTLQDKWLIAEGTKATSDNYKNWNIQADSLLITFDEYQVAPYVDGAQEVEIPLAELTQWIAADAPVMAEFKKPTIPTEKTKKIASNQQWSKTTYNPSDLLN
jgi:hypothetical protein